MRTTQNGSRILVGRRLGTYFLVPEAFASPGPTLHKSCRTGLGRPLPGAREIAPVFAAFVPMLKVESILRPRAASRTSRSMWCAKCRKDAPAVPSRDDPDAIQCLLCGAKSVLASDLSASGGAPAADASAQVVHRVESACPIEPPPRIAEAGDWETPAGRTARVPSTAPVACPTRDLASILPRTAPRSLDRSSIHRPRSNAVCWLLLTLGIALFACGASLIGYSFLGEREALWDLGTPLVLAGQATFLVGLVLQLDVIWQQSRDTHRTLRQLDQRLSPPKELSTGPVPRSISATDVNGGVHPGNRAVAAPHLALRELKGRLETIGNQLTGQRS